MKNTRILDNKQGTKEWAVKNVNIITGCSHDCLYCYAHGMARRFDKCDDWSKPTIRTKDVEKKRRLENGVVMFPSSHDITPEFIEPCMVVLEKLLAAGNQVLIVSKPHIECVRRMCADFAKYKAKILFRFTIGAADNAILSYWEPGAPSYEERLQCLQYAFDLGFGTSVSMEPMLDTPHAVELFHQLEPFVTDTIWIGKLNRPRSCIADWEQHKTEIHKIEMNQTDAKILAIYDALKDEPKVAWKDSIREVIGSTQPAAGDEGGTV